MKYVIIGVGKVGYAAARFLLDFEKPEKMLLLDSDDTQINKLKRDYQSFGFDVAKIDLNDYAAMVKAIKPYDSVLCCLPYNFNIVIAKVAIEAGCNYCDLGGNDEVTDSIFQMDKQAKNAGVSVVPDTGLAPGLVSLIAADFHAKFPDADEISLRVGGLPQNPVPPFNYQVTFSAQGLINEYKEPVRILKDGKQVTVESLGGLESFDFPGMVNVEAFYTSGGISTLPRTFEGKINLISYKTIRFPGHCNILKSFRDTGFFDESPPIEIAGSQIQPRKILEAFLEQKYTSAEPDMILLYCEASIKGKTKAIYSFIDRGNKKRRLTAMQKCTAIPAAVASVMQTSKGISRAGAIPQEEAFDADEYLRKVKEWGIDLEYESF